MKILFLAAASSIHTVKWVNSLSKKGHEVHLAFNKGHAPKQDAIHESVFMYELQYKGTLGYYLNASELKRLSLKIQPDIINAHYASGYGTLARKAKLSNIILSVWGSDVYDFPYESIVKRIIVKKNLSYATKIASTSYCMAEQVKTVMGNKNLDIAVTPFGVDLDLFNANLYSKTDKEKIIIGNIKALLPKYGIKELILSIETLLHDTRISNSIKERLRFEIYGAGEQKEELQNLIESKNLTNYIFLMGSIPNTDVPNVLSTFDIFCALSQKDSESFGVSAVEAMAMGVPVVCSDVDGFKEVVEDNKTGLIVNRNNIEDAKNALITLITDSNLRKKFGVNGRKRVQELYNWEDNVKTMEKVYVSVLEGNRK